MQKFRKMMISLLSLGMAFTAMPVYAEDSTAAASPESTSEADNQENTADSKAESTASPESTSDSSDSSGEVKIEAPSSADTTVTSSGDNGSKTTVESSDNAVKEKVTDKDILNAADGDSERASLLKKEQAYIEEDRKKDPHFTLYLAGNGYVDITSADGTITEYRRGSKVVKYIPADTQEESDAKVKGANDAIQESEKDLSDTIKNNTRVYEVAGNAGDKIHLKAVADEDEHIVTLASNDYESVVSVANDIIIDDRNEIKDTYETDITLRNDACASWSASFSETENPFVMSATTTGSNGGSTGQNNLLRAISQSLVKSNPVSYGYSTSGGGRVYISGYTGNNIWNNKFKISNATDPAFAAALAKVGGSNIGSCQNHGDYAPPDGTYDISWNMTVHDDGSIDVHYTVGTRDIHSAWGMYNNAEWLQSVSGDFSTPPTNKTIYVNIYKRAQNQYILSLFANDLSLQGASFDIFADIGCTQKLDSVTTDGNGNASASRSVNIGLNTVYVKETKAPKGFDISDKVYTVDLTDGTSGSVTVLDKTTEKVKIVKKDENGNQLAGAYLTMKNIDTGDKYSWVSDGTPHVVECDPGRYTLTETNPPDGYYPADPISFTVYPNKDNQTYTMTDIPIKYGADKIDQTTGAPVAGAKLQLIDLSSGTAIEEWTTTAETHVFGADHSLALGGWNGKLKWGNMYAVKEIDTTTGYELKEETVSFKIDNTDKASQLKVVHIGPFKNIEFNYYAAKLDADTNEYLKGVTLELKDENGKVLDRWVTDGTDHKINYKLLTLHHKYYIHEAKTIEGYYSMAEDVEFTADNTGGLKKVIKAYDYKIKYEIAKVDADATGTHVAGVTLALYDKTAGNTLIDKWVTESDLGTPVHKLDYKKLNAGHTYVLKELATVPGYYLNDTLKEFTIPEKCDSDYLKYYVTETMANPRIHLYVAKLDGITKDPIVGAQLQIQDASGNVMTNITTTNQKETEVDISNYKAGGTYYLVETKPVDGYYYMEDKVKIEIPATWSDAITKKVVTGIHVTGYDYPIKYQISKVDKKGNPVAGATFALYHGTQKITGWTSTTEPHYLDPAELKLVAGETYTVKEIGIPKGYYHGSDITFTVPKFPASKEDIDKVTHGEIISKSFADQGIQWKIFKYEISSGKKTVLYSQKGVPFTFEVYDVTAHPNDAAISASDKKIADLSTDDLDYISKGYFELSDELQAGHYYKVRETSCPNGYTKAADSKAMYVPMDPGKTTNGDDYVLNTEITDQPFSVRMRKVDGNGNTLTTYTTRPDNKINYFEFDIYDTADNSKVATVSTGSDEYLKSGYIDMSSYMKWGHIYKIVETAYPTGYYRAQDAYVNVNSTSIDIKMTDPPVKAKFRKDDENGEPLRSGFKFRVVDVKADYAVCTLDMSKTDKQGFVEFGEYLKEDTEYRIEETEHTKDYDIALPKTFRTPKYYQSN